MHIALDRRWRACLAAGAMALGSTAALVVAPAPPAGAAGTPDITLTEQAPASVLYGTPATVTLTAHNGTATSGYNLSFEDALPLGVTYVAGSTSPAGAGDPTVITLGSGATTLVWSNVANLQPSNTEAISFKVQAAVDPAADAVLPGSSYTDSSSAYVNGDPRFVPAFDPTTGAPVAGSFTGSATASGTTQITPIQISKAEPSPESELPRGVHDHKTTYTLTVTNDRVHATDAVTVTDWLPAGLEYLGCGGVDHTTNASGTNPGSTQEYPGSGPLSAGTALASPSPCPAPASVDTVVADPVDSSGNPIGSGVYTLVTWNLGNLAAGQVATIEYLAAVPLRENTITWSGTTPTPASLGQAANLDNNNGPETTNDQALENVATTSGTYTGPFGPGVRQPGQRHLAGHGDRPGPGRPEGCERSGLRRRQGRRVVAALPDQ